LQFYFKLLEQWSHSPPVNSSLELGRVDEKRQKLEIEASGLPAYWEKYERGCLESQELATPEN